MYKRAGGWTVHCWNSGLRGLLARSFWRSLADTGGFWVNPLMLAAAWMKLPGIVRGRDISICCMCTPGWQGALNQLDGGFPVPGRRTVAISAHASGVVSGNTQVR
jgi:hypothetical protein